MSPGSNRNENLLISQFLATGTKGTQGTGSNVGRDSCGYFSMALCVDDGILSCSSAALQRVGRRPLPPGLFLASRE